MIATKREASIAQTIGAAIALKYPVIPFDGIKKIGAKIATVVSVESVIARPTSELEKVVSLPLR